MKITSMTVYSSGTPTPAFKGLSTEEIRELMRALGFHRIDSRNRWKMKIVDKMEVTDASIKSANESGKLAEYLSAQLEQGFQGLKNLQVRKKVLTAFFKT